MNNTSLKLIDYYKLSDLNLNNDETVQDVVNAIIKEKYKNICI